MRYMFVIPLVLGLFMVFFGNELLNGVISDYLEYVEIEVGLFMLAFILLVISSERNRASQKNKVSVYDLNLFGLNLNFNPNIALIIGLLLSILFYGAFIGKIGIVIFIYGIIRLMKSRK